MIDIKDISGTLLLSASIGEGSKRKFLLMKEDYITLKFSLEEPIHFKLGDYAEDPRFGLFEICDLQKPAYNTSTGGYDYELRLDAYYWKWKNKIFKYTPETGGQEASWNHTAPLDVQLGVFLRNLQALGYTYRGKDFEFSIDGSVENKAQLMSYDNTNLIDALSRMAETWECEWWVNGNQICFGRCEQGDPVDLEIGVNVEEMTRSDSQSAYATRIYAFGSTRNIPSNYRPVDESVVLNGVVQKRLMLPVGTPYIDAYPNMRTEEAVEQVVIFDDVYPRRTGTMSDITTHEYTDKIEEEGKEPVYKKWNAYRFKDTGIMFSKDYVLEGQELKIIFRSGSLNGMEFAVTFNPCDKEGGETPIPEKNEDGSWNPLAQVWEIVRNEDYGRELPGDVMVPKNGDTYVLSGFDTKFVSDAMIPDAENELKEKAQKYIAKSKVDPSTYENRMMPGSIYSEDGLYKLFDVGDRVNLINKTYFENGRQSRIIGFEYNLDIPYDHPVYTVGETASYSRIRELEGKLESLTLAGQTYTGGGGSGIYVIRTNDSTPAGNGNVFSALRSLATFLCKNKPDRTNFLLKLLGGAEVGEAIDSMLAGKGTILTSDGRIQTDRLEVRGYLKVMELLFNRVLAQEADFTFSESGTIEKVEPQADGTYNLTMRKRHDTDFTAFAEQDVAYGAVNTLVTAGEYYTSWFRVLSVNTVANTVNAVLYPDGEVPGGQNFPPSVGMVITRRGNAVNEERQSYWYLSGYEHCICMLDGVTKPVLEENNYSVIIGKLKNLSLFDNLPINYRHSYIYCRGIAIQDLLRIDYQGIPIVQLNDRGEWSAETAAGEHPYTIAKEYVDTVWHFGCRWKCLVSGTLSEPNYASAGWAMIEGNPEFTIDIDSSNGFEFDYDDFATVLTLTGKIYNRDITAFLLDTDIAWTRDTGNVSEDNAWAVKRSGAGKTLPLTLDDLGPDHTTLGKCFFKATALLRDGEVTNEAEAVINF